MNNLKETLDNLIIAMQEYPTLNYGGCCMFASEVAHLLYEKGYVVFIRVYDDVSNENLNEVRKNNNTLKIKYKKLMSCMHKNNVYFGHVMLELDINSERILFDSDGYYKFDEVSELIYNDGSKILKGRLTLEEARKLSVSSRWNRRFNRELIPIIKTKIELVLKDLIEV